MNAPPRPPADATDIQDDRPDEELRSLCAQIIAESLSEAQWAERESDDMFQSEHYCGGFESEEAAFSFSHYRDDGSEWWFQLSLNEVARVAQGDAVQLNSRPSE